MIINSVFKIEPIEEKNKQKKHTLKDFAKLQCKSGDASVSKNIDKIFYLEKINNKN